MAVICANCNAILEDTAKFCSQCGTPVTVSSPPVSSMTEQKDREAIKQELEEEAKKYGGKILDFDSNKPLLRYRAERWTVYQIQQFDDDDWYDILWAGMSSDSTSYEFKAKTLFHEEYNLIWTNKPNSYKALFLEEVINQYIEGAYDYGYLFAGTLTEKAVSLFGHLKTTPTGKLPSFHQPDLGNIRAIANKDKELFPDPEPLRAEVAGAILNSTKWEAALVVYMDCAYKGKYLTLRLDGERIVISNELRKIKQEEADIVERTVGNEKICAAIFSRIPLVTDWHRAFSYVLTRLMLPFPISTLSLLTKRLLLFSEVMLLSLTGEAGGWKSDIG
jgi:hypothetical protein